VLAPVIAANIFSPAVNFSDSTGDDRLLQPKITTSEVFSDRRMYSAHSGYWTWNGVDLHLSQFKIAFADNGQKDLIWFAGKFPDRAALVDQLSGAGSGHNLHPVQAQGIFADSLKVGSWDLPLPSPVIRMGNSGPEAWWKIVAGSGQRIFWLRESDGLFGEESPVVMGSGGIARVYRENKVVSGSTGLEEFPLTDLLDVTYLRNRLFRVLNCMGGKASFLKCGNYARSADGRFLYAFDSVQYSEMTAYYSVQKAMEWHRGVFSESHKKFFSDFNLAGPIDVFVRNVTSGGPSYSSRNVGLNTSNPVIFVPEEFSGLVNLSRDSDVYFHEFSHHVIYRSVKPTNENPQSQARAIQEGLADYFTYAMTGNNLLGESVTEGSSLRQGTKDTALVTEIFGDAYAAGELLSSVLWTLRTENGDWKGNYKRIDKVVWDAVDFMPELGTFYQFACALVKTADAFEKSENLTAGTLKTPLTSRLAERQFFEDQTIDPALGCPKVSAVLKAVDEGESQPSELPLDVKLPAPVTFTGAAVKALPPFGGSLYQALQPRKVGCGVLAAAENLSQVNWISSVILLVPAFFSARRRRRFFR
jgi:hypothetical protein